MISITVYKQSSYPVNSRRIKETIKETLENQGLVSDCELSLAILGKNKMQEVSRKYLAGDKSQISSHPVLAFPTDESKKRFVFPPDKKIHLGEILISYHLAREKAKKNNCLIEEVILELVRHGTLHLLGVHKE